QGQQDGNGEQSGLLLLELHDHPVHLLHRLGRQQQRRLAAQPVVERLQIEIADHRHQEQQERKQRKQPPERQRGGIGIHLVLAELPHGPFHQLDEPQPSQIEHAPSTPARLNRDGPGRRKFPPTDGRRQSPAANSPGAQGSAEHTRKPEYSPCTVTTIPPLFITRRMSMAGSGPCPSPAAFSCWPAVCARVASPDWRNWAWVAWPWPVG